MTAEITLTGREARHSSKSSEWATPPEILEAARRTMDPALREITLDPATSDLINHEFVRARFYYTIIEDGLSRPWTGNVWLNPPGGKIENRSLTKIWWRKLVDEYAAGRVEQACFLGFNLDVLQTTQWDEEKKKPESLGHSVMDYPICIPNRRLKFWFEEPDKRGFKEGGGPTHANVIVYLPPRVNSFDAKRRFAEQFQFIGRCKI